MNSYLNKDATKTQIVDPILKRFDKVCIILRGIPGSGKSTIGELFGGTICSADHFFTDAEGYHFDPSKLKQAHNQCFNNAKRAMVNGDPVIVIDNTSTSLWSFARYIELASDNKYPFTIITVQCDPETAHSRCVHDVPSETIMKMANQLECGTEQMTEEMKMVHVFV